MNVKKKLFTAAEICLYVGTFLWLLAAACEFAVSNAIYYLFAAFGIIAVCTGLCSSTLKTRIKKDDFDKKDDIRFIVYTVLSIVVFPATILYIVARFGKFADKEIAAEAPKNAGNAENRTPADKTSEKPAADASAKKQSIFKKKSFIVSVICVAAIIFSSFSAMLFETSGFFVKVNDFKLTKEMTEEYNSKPLNGKSWVIQDDALSYTVTEYIPKTATKENPAPVIFVMPGFTRTRTTMAQYAIEYSRRGAVVFVIDPGCQGGTTYSGYKEDGSMISSTVGANGLDYLVQYVSRIPINTILSTENVSAR